MITGIIIKIGFEVMLFIPLESREVNDIRLKWFNANKPETIKIIGKKDNSVSADLLSIIKFKKLIIKVKIIMVSIQVITVLLLYPFERSMILKGITAKSGKKLKKEITDLPKT